MSPISTTSDKPNCLTHFVLLSICVKTPSDCGKTPSKKWVIYPALKPFMLHYSLLVSGMLEMFTMNRIIMSETSSAKGHTKLIDELSLIASSEKLKTGNLQTLKSVYLKMNLAYISVCERDNHVPYMSSSRSDILFERYSKCGDLSNARIVVEKRLDDILKLIKLV